MNKSYLVIILVVVVAGAAAAAFFMQSEPRIVGTKALVIVADGFAYTEYTEFIAIFQKDGGTVHTASFTTETVEATEGNCRPDVTFYEVNLSLYDVVYVVGGGGVDLIVAHQNKQVVLNILIQAYNEEKIVAAICSGTWLLGEADIVNGKTVTCGAGQDVIDSLKAHGSTVDRTKGVIRDENVITGLGPSYTSTLAGAVIDAIIEKQT